MQSVPFSRPSCSLLFAVAVSTSALTSLGGCSGAGDGDGEPASPEPSAGEPSTEPAAEPEADLGDGGVVDPCQQVPSGPLGSATLEAGFVMDGSADLSADVVAVALRGTDVFAVSGTSVVGLGGWPALGEEDVVASIIGGGDDAAASFASYYLVDTGSLLIAGYTSFDAATGEAPGQLALIDTAASPATVTHINAPSNYSAAVTSTGRVLVNGKGLADDAGAGLYALESDGSTTQIGSFGDTFAGSGFTAVTSNGVVVTGDFTTDFVNVLYTLSSENVDAAATGTAIDLDALAPLTAQGPLSVAAFGEGVAVAEGFYDENFSQVSTAIVFTPLSSSGGDVTAGTPVTVLSFPDACTIAKFVMPAGDDLFVALTTGSQTTLVRIAAQ